VRCRERGDLAGNGLLAFRHAIIAADRRRRVKRGVLGGIVLREVDC
jgi:hypothetical protein